MNDEKKKALEVAILKMVRSNAIDIIVIDSVAALVPKAEIDGDMGDVHMGLQAYPEKEIFLIWRQMWILSEKVVPGILMRA